MGGNNMQTIKITNESLARLRKEQSLIAAPIDNKNVTTDWIEDIFDNQNCTWGNKMAVGFIKDTPVIASWHDNVLIWTFPTVVSIEESGHLAELMSRLKEYNDANPELWEAYDGFKNFLMQKFYWDNDYC